MNEMIFMSAELNDIEPDEFEDETPESDFVPGFVVDSDIKADWVVRKIAEKEASKVKWGQFYDTQKKAMEDSFMFQIARLKQYLIPYLQHVQMKEGKTQKKYALMSGDLIIKKEHTKIEHDDDKLLDWLKVNASEYVKTKESVDWRALKENLFESGGEYFLRDTGEKVPGVTDTLVPAEFEVKAKMMP